jgi:hypothetical protein
VLAVKQAAATISERMLKSEKPMFGRGGSDGANHGVNESENDASADEARGLQ